ncbi:basement membrane-specific heparan sulfate proteoglycan core protein-like [Antedon mediterranea]|uniref:basement membrane-specific heparan sulfate proteoglycan core protein-like n=1 Tax=Antedon mediterranea TaxID=105859 RepID=UPI003AF41B8A
MLFEIPLSENPNKQSLFIGCRICIYVGSGTPPTSGITSTIVAYYRVSFIITNFPISAGGLEEGSQQYNVLYDEINNQLFYIYQSISGRQEINGLTLIVEDGAIRASFDIISIQNNDGVEIRTALFSVISSGSLGNLQVEPESLTFNTLGDGETSSVATSTTAQPRPCRGDAQFYCSNGNCLDSFQVCDGYRDCPNGDDEQSCSCSIPGSFVCETQICISGSLRCDGFNDCSDGSDEINCQPTTTCKIYEFSCANGECRPNNERCDGKYDCADSSDEDSCASVATSTTAQPRPCRGDAQFYCSNGNCLDSSQICNGNRDCPNGDDEQSCSCSIPGSFVCETQICISGSLRCDGFNDCSDGSDEINCQPTTTCKIYEFSCANGECRPNNERCDGKYDCADSSDEDSCDLPPNVCGDNQFRCLRDFECIDEVYICDEFFDCGDYSDEENCGVITTLPPSTTIQPPIFPCREGQATCNNGQCIQRSFVCDGDTDCADNSDEIGCGGGDRCEPNEFQCNNGFCALKIWRCDGDTDCTDGSDEINCPTGSPNDACSAQEYQCLNSKECIPKAYRCDDEMDCIDRSDEIGCAAPVIIKPPTPRKTYYVGDTITLICVAEGIPYPHITWRLNWGSLPDSYRITTTSVQGNGVLTITDARKTDQGAYTCEATNVKDSILAVPDAIIIVLDRGTDICQQPTFNDNAEILDDCIDCFCFGITSTCYSSGYYESEITIPFDIQDDTFGVQLIHEKDGNQTSMSAYVQVYSQSKSIAGRELYRVPGGDLYWFLPSLFTGNQLTSYGSYLSYSFRYINNDNTRDFRNDVYDVIMKSGDIVLAYKDPVPAQKEAIIDRRIRMWEAGWVRLSTNPSDPEGPPKVTPVSRAEFMLVLQNIRDFQLQSLYDRNTRDFILYAVSMGTSVNSNTGLQRAFLIEDCQCPIGYMGLSCERCGPGYYRNAAGNQYIGTCTECSRRCNSNTNDCHPETGACRNCGFFTAGERCDICADGYFGDPLMGIDCRPCPCPLEIASNQFSRTCYLDTDGLPTCDRCPQGYEGRRCERCAKFYDGNPVEIGSSCGLKGAFCNTDGYSSVDSKGNCICKENVQGSRCSSCKADTFFLAPKNPLGCISCFCMGVSRDCSSSTFSRDVVYVSFDQVGENYDMTLSDPSAVDTNANLIIRPAARELSFSLFGSLPRDTYYWNLPDDFTGNKLSSYGGNLRYSVAFSSAPSSTPNNEPDVILIGNGHRLYHFSNISLTPGRLQSVSVPFFENAWKRPDGDPVPRENFMMAITNLNSILIRASYATSMTETSIRDISLDVAYNYDTNRDLAYEVEQCVCPPAYEGLSCERCAPGYTRTGAGLYLGVCGLCDCSGHSEECDPESGICRNCRDNTVGAYCDRCAPGFYRFGPSDTCNPCPCPFGTSCEVNTNTFDVVCTNCPTGTTGDLCENCAPGFTKDNRGECVRSGSCDCNLDGSISNDCQIDSRGDIPTSSCPCKQFVTGDKCDECSRSYFNLASSNPDGCLKCFCMGITPDCTSSTYYRQRNYLRFPNSVNPAGTRLVNSDQSASYDGPFSINVAANEINFNGFENLQPDTYYWKLSSRFLDNQLTAYGGKLRFTINYRIGSQGGIQSQDPEVLQLAGNDITLIHRADQVIRPGQTRIFEVDLVETSFVRPDGEQATREHIIMTLADLDTILIRASYHTGTYETRLWDVSMDTAAFERSEFGLAPEIERCYCPTGYIGLSCEDCAYGFTRSGDGLYLGRCAPCECNGHSNECDPETGVCFNCHDNTYGDFCDFCKPGYYGDASIGCQQCACPLVEPSNNFSPICELDTLNNLRCTACPIGYQGTRCERCAPGYVGSPTVINGKCTLDQSGPAPEVSIRPSSISGVESESVTLRCYVTGSATSVVWRRADTRPLSSRAQQLSNNFLRIVNVQPEDEGEYICIAYNNEKSGFASCVLTVVSPYISVYVEEPRVLELKIGETARFMCRAESKTTYTLAWMKQSGFLPAKAESLPNGDLIIENVDQTDVGVYACIGSNMFEMDKAMVNLRITDGPEPPEVRISPTYRQITEGNTVDFICSANGSPTPTLRWTRIGGEITNSALILNGMLRFPYVSVNDAGSYQCEASNIAGSKSAVARLDVTGISLPTPEITPQELQFNAGQNAEFTCTVSDPSTTTIEWSRADGLPLPENAFEAGNTLYIQSVRPEDSGQYVCTARNAAGSRYTTCNLLVKEDFRVAPNATIIRDRQFVNNILTIQQGRPYVLQCFVTGDPQPTIQWEKGLGLTSNHRISEDGVFLTIQNAQPEDRDYYSCIAENLVGYNRDYVQIDIQRRSIPQIEIYPEIQPVYAVGDNAQFQCRVTAGDPSPEVEWSYAEGTQPISAEIIGDVLRFNSLRQEDQGTYICLASNIAGQVSISLTLTLQGSLPRVSITPDSPAEYRQGDEALFECIGTGSPTPSIHWMKMDDGTRQYTRMANEAGMTISSAQGSAMLSISSIVDADAGQYMCRAENAAGYAQKELVVSVLPREQNGEVVVTPTDLRITQGEAAQFSCSIEGAAPGSYTVMWRRVSLDMPESHGISNGILTIYNTQAEDAGEYYCVIETRSGFERYVVSLVVYAPPVADVMPTSQTLIAGESIQLQCVAKQGTGPLTYTWDKEGGVIPYTAIIGDYGLLTIHFASANDTGRYICTCSNSAGSSRSYSDITVLVPPKVTVVPYSLMRAIGSAVEFNCRVLAGSPTPRITWEKENGQMPDSVSYVNNNLVLSNLAFEDEGIYICRAENSAGSSTASGKLTLQAPPAVEITVHTAVQFVAIGESVTFECKASGDPTPTIRWTRVDAEIPFSAQIEEGMLTIPIVQLADAGTYKCIATNVVSSVDSQVILYVQAAPQAVIQPSTRTVSVGSVVVFTCLATGYPSPRISWRKLEGDLPANRVINRGVMTINQVVKEDAGTYICVANNTQGSVEYTAALYVGGFVPYFQQMPLSFIQYPKLSDAYKEFEIDLSFKPESTEGLLLYNGQKTDGNGDFFSFGLNNGYAEFRFELGGGVAIIRSEESLQLGQWHTVTLKRQSRTGQMLVHGQREVSGESGGQFLGMDLQLKLYLGGVPNFGEIARNTGLGTGFIGCVSQLVIEGEKVDLGGDALSQVGVTSCQVCEDNPCLNGGVCSESGTEVGYQCSCNPGFVGDNCELQAEQCFAGACGVGECVAQDGVFGFTCRCPLGWTGDRCETDSSGTEGTEGSGNPSSYITPTFSHEDDGILFATDDTLDGFSHADTVTSSYVTDLVLSLVTPLVTESTDELVDTRVFKQVTIIPNGGDMALESGELTPSGSGSGDYDYYSLQGDQEVDISTPSFSEGSYLAYPSLRPVSRIALRIRMTFKPDTDEDGILLFNGQMQDGAGDYIAVYIKDRQIVFQYDSGSKAAVITGTSEINAGQWHTFVAERNRRDGSLQIDGSEAIKGQSPIGSSGLDVPLQLFIGGVDQVGQIPSEVSVTSSFKGCLSEISISDNVLEVNDHLHSANVGDCSAREPCHNNPCQNKGVCTPAGLNDYYCICGSGYQGKDCELLRGPCETRPCQNGGSCVPLGEEYKCLCGMDYTGPNCEFANTFFNSIDVTRDGYLALRSDLIPRNINDQEQLKVSFKTLTPNGVILWQGVEAGEAGRQRDFISLGIKDGYLVFMFQLGSGIAEIKWTAFRVDDDVEHVAYIQRSGTLGYLTVDDNVNKASGEAEGQNVRLDVPGPVYLGGAPDVSRHTGGQFTMGIVGCISKLQIHSGEVNLQSEAVGGENVGPCN